MTPRTTTGNPPARRARRPMRISVAAVATVLIGMMTALAWSASQLRWWTPSPGGTSEHTSTFGPAVVATVVDVICLLVVIGMLVHAISRRPVFRLLGAIVGVLAIVSVAVTSYAAVAPRPSF